MLLIDTCNEFTCYEIILIAEYIQNSMIKNA